MFWLIVCVFWLVFAGGFKVLGFDGFLGFWCWLVLLVCLLFVFALVFTLIVCVVWRFEFSAWLVLCWILFNCLILLNLLYGFTWFVFWLEFLVLSWVCWLESVNLLVWVGVGIYVFLLCLILYLNYCCVVLGARVLFCGWCWDFEFWILGVFVCACFGFVYFVEQCGCFVFAILVLVLFTLLIYF